MTERPNRTDFLPFSKPTISKEAIAEVVTCLESGWITTGPRVQAFEQKLGAYVGAPFVLAMSSATGGLYMTLKALDLKQGDEVITTPMTFAATLNTIVLAGGKPVLVDVEPHTFNIDVTKIEAAITPRTRAIMPVHFAGLPVDLDPLYEIAKKHNLRVIEDAAHAIGTEYKGKKIGSFGDIQVFSFHPNKNMTTGEGGAISFRDESLTTALNLERFHGIDRAAWNRNSKEGSQHYLISRPAHKFNMMDIQAAIGLHQLEDLDTFIEKRTKIAQRYMSAFKDHEGLVMPGTPSYSYRHAWHLFTPLINIEKAKMTRDEFMEKLKALNIGTGYHYQAMHLHPYYQETYGYRRGDFPNAEKISDQIVSLPLFPLMNENDQQDVINAVTYVLKQRG